MRASLVCTPTLVDSELTNPQIVSQTMTECILIRLLLLGSLSMIS